MTTNFFTPRSAYKSFLSILFAGLAGCSTILDSQAGGTSPTGPGSLPGAPSGDSLSASGNVQYQQSSIQLLTSSQTQTGVAFRPTQNQGNPSEYSVSLVGSTQSTGPVPVLAIDIIDTAQRRACGLEISNNEFRLVSDEGTNVIGSANPTPSGPVEHRIIMRLSKDTNRCFINIRLFEQGEIEATALLDPVITADGGFTDADFDVLERVQITWESVQPDTGQLRYSVGPVTISAR